MTHYSQEKEEMSKRPGISEDLIMAVAQALVKGTPFEAEDVASCYSRMCNGFDIARNLDSLGYDGITADDVTLLDRMDDLVNEEHRRVCWEWVRKEEIQPPYPVGTELDNGIIHSISEHYPAYYHVKEYGCTQENRHLLIRFEDAVLRTS